MSSSNSTAIYNIINKSWVTYAWIVHCAFSGGETPLSVRANLAKISSCRIDPPTSLVYGGWHGKGRKKETEPRNTRVRALNR